jgi:hypothetical protein
MSKVGFSELKQKRIRKSFNNGIEIYNPNNKEKEEIINIIFKYIDFESKEINISGDDIIINILPVCSNIYLDIEDKELIKEIINIPSEELEESVKIIGEIVQELTDKIIENIKYLSTFTTEELINVLEIKNTISDEEIKQLEKLEAKAKKAGLR